ncbi:MAG: glycosyl transferase [Proteobacteria bacterium]|nr:glycosyl transferase [Pseudomonadota bacterium]
MIAYLILVHRFPEQFERMFKAIYHPANHYLVHVDVNSGTDLATRIARFIARYPNVAMLRGQKALWGGYSLVEAELRGMAQLLEMDAGWSHFINLSGQDFPLKSQAYIRDYLTSHGGTEFIRVLDQAKMRPDTMPRVRHFCIEARGRLFRTRIARPFLRGARPYIGTQWKIVSRAFCEFACHDPEATRFKRFFRHTFIADESFFQTLMMNGAPHGAIMPDDLREIDWVADGPIKLRPRTYGLADGPTLLSSANLFARKFDMGEDSAVLDLLERHIGAPQVAPLASAHGPTSTPARLQDQPFAVLTARTRPQHAPSP